MDKTLASAVLLVSVALFCGSAQSNAQVPDISATGHDTLRTGFANPGAAARPRVWWHWMNGNITRDGIRKDMEWMKRIGIAGLQSFDAGQATPQVVAERLPYMTDGWKAAFKGAAALADKLDLELGIAASPGWSETGGPWVTGPDAMKKMAWSETRITGGRRIRTMLAKPPTTTGVFQTSIAGTMLGGRAPGQNPPEFYADQKVIALPAPDDSRLPTPRITISGGTLDAAALSDGDITNAAARLASAPQVGGISWIQFDYGRPVVIRGLTVASSIIAAYYDGREPSLREGTPPSSFRLDASDDGRTWHDTGAIVFAGRPQRTIAVDNARARYFRFVSIRPAQPAPKPLKRFSRPVAAVPDTIDIRELVLRGEATVHSFEEKAAFYDNTHYYSLPTGTTGTVPNPDEVLDITDRMKPDGMLDWTAPSGNWVVLRIGYSLTGAMNRPASPEATGLEVDKLDPAAVKRYMDHYLAMYRDASGGLMGRHGLQAMMFDSWEASNENWTPKILDAFTRLRGYDATPWLPALAGFEIGSPEKSDAFLFDWRRTLQQLLKENHYELLTSMLHEQHLIRYGEAHEELFSTMGDGMEMKQSADIPMAAMWQVNKPGEIEPVYYNDIQESASVAHIYGQNVAAAEALTGGAPFGSAPWDLKPTADAILVGGVNRFVIHTSAHQPVDKGPGLTLGVGQYFTRNETWAEQAKPWVDYLSRASFLLQQGRGASDIAVFYGEGTTVIASYREIFPAVADGYRYDYVNSDALLNRISVRDGKLATQTGMAYQALLLGRGSERLTLPVLQKLKTLVEAGAILIGMRPEGSPSLSDDAGQVRAIIDTLWPGGDDAMVGKGRVFAASDTAGALRTIRLAPDFTYVKPQADSNVMFLHRRLADGHAYFLSNRNDRTERIEASFRVEGLAAELWDPATGETHPASYHIENGRTLVDVPLDRFGSVIVVFRGPAAQGGRQLATPATEVVATLNGPWQVAFQPDRGAPAVATFDHLADFRDNKNPGIRYFSGVATYRAALSLPARNPAQGSRLWLDLGEVHDLAEVIVNGRRVGTAWKPPYRVDIASAVKPGRNVIEIRSVNLWVNRLIGDVQPDVRRKVTFTAADGMMDATTAKSRSAQMPYRPDAPLRASGLIGPVLLVRESQQAAGWRKH